MKNVFTPAALLFLVAQSIVHAQITFDVEAIDAGPLSYITPGTYPVQVTVKNNNQDYYVPVMTASWQLDGGDVHSCTVNHYLIYGSYLYPTFQDRFTHNDSVTLISSGLHALKVWTSMPGNQPDSNPANDTVSITIHVVDSLPEKKLIVYYGTHTQCFPCGTYGEPQLAAIMDSFPDNACIITAHDGLVDPYNTEDAGNINDVYFWPFTGHPAFIYDQFKFPFFFNIVPYTFGSEWLGGQWRYDYRSPVEVKVKKVIMDTISRKIYGEVHARFFAEYAANLALNVAITEDSIWGDQDGVPGGHIYHRYVLRDLTDGIEGRTGIIPDTTVAGDEFIYEFEDSVAPDVNVKNLYVAGYVQVNSSDPLKREILNADQVRITDFQFATSAISDASSTDAAYVYPNPARDQITIANAPAAHDCKYELTNMLGQKLLSGHLGSAYRNISLSEISAGVYFLELIPSSAPMQKLRVVVAR